MIGRAWRKVATKRRERIRSRQRKINDEIWRRLAEPFPDNEVMVDRVGPVTSHYARRESYEKRLEEVLGLENFSYEYERSAFFEDSVVCRLRIELPDGRTVERVGLGAKGKMSNEDDVAKTTLTNAFKLACERFGVGRYLKVETRDHNRQAKQNGAAPRFQQPRPQQAPTKPTPPSPIPESAKSPTPTPTPTQPRATASPKAVRTDSYPNRNQEVVPKEHAEDRVNPIGETERAQPREIDETQTLFQQRFAGHAHNVSIEVAYQAKRDKIAPRLGVVINYDEAINVCALARVFFREWFLKAVKPFREEAEKGTLADYLKSLG